MNNKHITQIKPMSRPVALSIALLITLCSSLEPIAHADEPPPFNKVCEEEHQGETVRYVSDPDTNGFSRRHADVCFTEDKTTLFIEFKDYKPNLNSCSWRTTLNKKDDGYYKKTDECEVRMKFAEHQVITEFPNHCKQQCGYNAHFYSDTLTKQATLDPSKEKLTLLQSYSEICEPIMPEIAQHIRKDGQFNIGPKGGEFSYLSNIGYLYHVWMTDIDNDNKPELLAHIDTSQPDTGQNPKLYTLGFLSEEELLAFKKPYTKKSRKIINIVKERLERKLVSYPQLVDLEKLNALSEPLQLLIARNKNREAKNEYKIDVIKFKDKQYLIISNYVSNESRHAEMNLIDVESLPHLYHNLCNYRVNINYVQ